MYKVTISKVRNNSRERAYRIFFCVLMWLLNCVKETVPSKWREKSKRRGYRQYNFQHAFFSERDLQADVYEKTCVRSWLQEQMFPVSERKEICRDGFFSCKYARCRTTLRSDLPCLDLLESKFRWNGNGI